MLGGGNGVELRRKCLEVSIFSELVLVFRELALTFSLEMNLGWAQGVWLVYKVVLVDSF